MTELFYATFYENEIRSKVNAINHLDSDEMEAKRKPRGSSERERESSDGETMQPRELERVQTLGVSKAFEVCIFGGTKKKQT